MHSPTAIFLAVTLILGALSLPWSARSGIPDALDVDQLESGMVATVRTVLQGTDIEEFQIELVSVVRDIGPDQDMIVAKALGERLAHLGVAQGMSGSPVYVDGKLIGAVSATWSFTKDPLFGITPVHQMEREARFDAREGRASTRRPGGSQFASATDFLREAPPEPGDRGFAPIASPLVLSGFDRRLVNLAAELFDPWGFTVIEGGAAGVGQEGGAIEPGATLGVRLVGGDANITAIGVVTWVDGDLVHGWGHPFFQMGDTEMPLVSGYIHTIVPSRMLSFKLGSGGDVVGTLTNDRRSGISGRLGAMPRLTQFDLAVTRRGETERYHYEIVRDPNLGPALVGILASNSVLSRAGTIAEETVRFRQRIVLDDGRETEVETLFSGDQNLGQVVDLLSQAAGVIATNPFERVEIDRIEAELVHEPGVRVGFLTELSVDDNVLEPGDMLRGTYTIRTYRGDETKHRFAIPLPEDAREARYLLLVADSRTAERYEAERSPRSYAPRSLDEFLERIRRLKQTDEIHLQLYRQSEGVLIDGRPLADLPPSAMSVFRSASRSGAEGELPAEIVFEEQRPMGKFLQGGHTILLDVRKEKP